MTVSSGTTSDRSPSSSPSATSPASPASLPAAPDSVPPAVSAVPEVVDDPEHAASDATIDAVVRSASNFLYFILFHPPVIKIFL